ncbi:SH3 domain-containing protein [Moraxella sp. VT-16-12]|uniref:SH3 domain-containing protein n=1 Tax=Moraxella sp. VT-16-12 TaxID=2014877 RepID=UPI000B7DBF85|nr:SH3 domain-containing protein [Moraxella sp. VT-16-12]TWV83421.1 SH3 domain-containing protein [Moraxella sp. VT-16-12]
MKRLKSLLMAVGLSVAVAVPNVALAAETCMVTDPTDTPLNVRAAPGNKGKVIYTIDNGIIVTIVKYSKNKKWAYVRDADTREDIGWVYREYLSCSPSLKNR